MLECWKRATITPTLQYPSTPLHRLELEDNDEDEKENEASALVAAGVYERKAENHNANGVE